MSSSERRPHSSTMASSCSFSAERCAARSRAATGPSVNASSQRRVSSPSTLFSVSAMRSSSDLMRRRRFAVSFERGSSRRSRRAGVGAGAAWTGCAGSGGRRSPRLGPLLRSLAPLGAGGGRLGVVAGEGHGPAAPQVQNAGREPVDEGAVVRDEHDRAGKLVERLLQSLAGVEVEMVGRLVEQEQVVALPHDDRERQPALLAAREPRDRREHLVCRGTQTGPGTTASLPRCRPGCSSQTASIARLRGSRSESS